MCSLDCQVLFGLWSLAHDRQKFERPLIPQWMSLDDLFCRCHGCHGGGPWNAGTTPKKGREVKSVNNDNKILQKLWSMTFRSFLWCYYNWVLVYHLILVTVNLVMKQYTVGAHSWRIAWALPPKQSFSPAIHCNQLTVMDHPPFEDEHFPKGPPGLSWISP